MTFEQWIVLTVAMLALVAFISERIPTEIVSLSVLCVLAAAGIVDSKMALSGFASEAVVAVGAMFVLSAGLEASGAIRFVADLFTRYALSKNLFRALLMPISGLLSAFVNNTAVVAVLVPTVMRVARERGWSPQRFLIPLSFSSQFGGVCTLIGTSTNLLVHAMAVDAGLPGFTMFEFMKLGLMMLVIGIVYLMIFSRVLLPERPDSEAEASFQLGDFVTELTVVGKDLVGKSVESLKLQSRLGLTPIDLIRDDRRIWLPDQVPLQLGDILRVSGAIKDLTTIDEASGLRLQPAEQLGSALANDKQRRLLQVMVPAQSTFIDHSPGELRLAERFSSILLAVRRHDNPIVRRLSDIRFQVGDVALFMSDREGAKAIQESKAFVVLREDRHEPVPIRGVALPLFIAIAVVATAAVGWLPIYLSALMGGIALVMTRTLNSTDAFESVQWRVLFLIAGMLPLGLAIERTGLADVAVNRFVAVSGDASPWVVLSLLYLTTAILTEFLSNNAAAVLLVPVGLSLATHFGIDPKPFLVAITFAASSSFTTPVGYQTNTMVYGAGNYRFMDFVRIGLPLNLVFWLVASFAIPHFFPFQQVAP